MDLIPNSVIGAFADNNVLQVLLFSVLFGSALNLVGEAASGITRLINELSHVIFRIMGMIVRLAPIGVFGAIACHHQHLRPRFDRNTRAAWWSLFYLTCFAFVALILGVVMRVSGLRMLPLLKYLREELLIVMGTASSASMRYCRRSCRKLEHLGIGSSDRGPGDSDGIFVQPGRFLDLRDPGHRIYCQRHRHAAVDDRPADHPAGIADHLQGRPRHFRFGAGDSGGGAYRDPGDSGGGACVLVLAVDWFMGIGRALTNLIGNCVAAVVDRALGKDIDIQRANKVLDGQQGFTPSRPRSRYCRLPSGVLKQFDKHHEINGEEGLVSLYAGSPRIEIMGLQLKEHTT